MANPRPRLTKVLVVIAVALGVASSLSGCSSPRDDAFRVVTTTTQITDFARNVVGDAGEVYPLLQANQSAHSFDPSARDLLELSRADVLVINGGDLEPWVDDAVAASNFSGEIIDASVGVSLLQSGETESQHNQAAEETATHDHGNSHGDPHIWSSPKNAKQMVTNIADGLAAAQPENAVTYETNAEAYVGKLGVLDEWVFANVEQIAREDRLLVTNHDAFTYFVSEYGITFVGSIIPEFDDNAEPSAADIDSLVEKIRATGVRAIFAESSISPKLAEAVAAQANIQIFAGAESLYADTLGATGSGAETYISATIHNVRLLVQAWGVPLLPVPEEISHV